MSQVACLFCRVVGGKIPSSVVADDELVMAFLDIRPINPGHVLVVPKDHHAGITDLPVRITQALWSLGQRLAIALKSAPEVEGINLLMNEGAAAGQEVPHAHLHVIPRTSTDSMRIRIGSRPTPSAEDLAQRAEWLKSRLVDPSQTH